MGLGRSGSINNLYTESLFCQIATFFWAYFNQFQKTKREPCEKGKRFFNSFFEGESNAQLSPSNIFRSTNRYIFLAYLNQFQKTQRENHAKEQNDF